MYTHPTNHIQIAIRPELYGPFLAHCTLTETEVKDQYYADGQTHFHVQAPEDINEQDFLYSWKCFQRDGIDEYAMLN